MNAKKLLGGLIVVGIVVAFIIFAVLVAVAMQPTSAPRSVDARAQRLLAADPVYRNQGAVAWARHLGFTYDSLTMEARQPEEETFSESATEAMTVVSGIQVKVTNLKAHSPGCFTTDQVVSGNSRFVKPDNSNPINNPSVLYTDNEIGYSGTVTMWGDCSNWDNLVPASATTLTMAYLSKLGRVIQRLEDPAGTLAGAQIEFSTAWTAPEGWVIQKNGVNVSSVTTGDTASVWSPEEIRPLKD